MIEPSLLKLSKTYKLEKKICRICYATNPINSLKCRKKKCGRSSQLRLKKKKKNK